MARTRRMKSRHERGWPYGSDIHWQRAGRMLALCRLSRDGFGLARLGVYLGRRHDAPGENYQPEDGPGHLEQAAAASGPDPLAKTNLFA